MAELEDGTYMIRNGQLYKIELPESFFKVKGAKTVKIPKFEVIPISKPSNADQIRSMTDEKLAEFLFRKERHCPTDGNIMKCGSYETCEDCWLTWLKQEIEEE